MNIYHHKTLPSISIIIPIYNVEQYVEECLRSVLQQDYELMEIILIDDCGADNSMKIVEEIISHCDKNVIVLKHEKNRGISAARNTGIKQATGDYLFFLDSDDYITPNCLTNLAHMAMRYPDAEIVYGRSKAVPYQWLQERFFTYAPTLKEYYNSRRKIQRMILNEQLTIVVWNRLIKHRWLLENNLLFREGITAEDLHWFFFASKHINHIAFCKAITHYYRENPTGITHSQLEKSLKSRDLIIVDFLQHLSWSCLLSQLHLTAHLMHTQYVVRYGGASRPVFIRVFYPILYFFRNFTKII